VLDLGEALQKITATEQEVQLSQCHQHEIRHSTAKQYKCEHDNSDPCCKFLCLAEHLDAEAADTETHQNKQKDNLEYTVVDHLCLELVWPVKCRQHNSDETKEREQAKQVSRIVLFLRVCHDDYNDEAQYELPHVSDYHGVPR
jgi:hypothetical protein